jgi:DNA-binding FadR family transcriptional regulator
MGMRVDSSTSTSATQGAAIAGWQQKQQNFKDLFSAIQSGDMSSAQNALKALTGGSGTVNSSSPLAAIAHALQAGDVQGAQKAAQDFQTRRQEHHHHHGQANQSAAAAPAASQPSSGPGSLLSVKA